jgi:predicted nucleotidyltransferase
MIEAQESTVDPAVLKVARAFVSRVSDRYPVVDAILFGSRARGRFREDSDVDVAVLLADPPGRFLATKLEMADIAYDLLLETGVLIEPLPIWEGEWQSPDSWSNPVLLRNIEREGVRL